MTTLLVINEDKCAPGLDFKRLRDLGYEIMWTTGNDVPSVQVVSSKEDRRFTAACAAMQGMLSNSHLTNMEGTGLAAIVAMARRSADALLAELDKPT